MNNGQVLKKNRYGTEYIEVNGEIITKRCTSCEEMKELEHFYKSKTGLGGAISKCKPCAVEHAKKYDKEYYDTKYSGENRERINARKKESDKKYYEKNKAKIAEKRRKTYEKSKERILEYGKNYYKENRERILEDAKEAYKRKKEN